MLSALDRFLRDQGKKCCIFKRTNSFEMQKSPGWQSYRAEGKIKHKADALNDEEEEKLWDTGVLGCKNPKSLKYTVFLCPKSAIWYKRVPRTSSITN